MKSRLLQILKFAIGWPLSVVALYFIYRMFSAQLGKLTVTMEINPYFLLIGAFCFISYYFLRSYLWLKLLHFLGHDIPFRESSFLWLLAQLKRYIPGNIWSFLGLAVSYSEHKIPKKDLAYAVWIESELVIIVTFIISLLSLPFILTNFIAIPVPVGQVTALLTALFLAGAVIYLYLGVWLTQRKGRIYTVLRHIFPKFTPGENLFSILLMAAAYILYGFGYYFSIAAIFPLNPEYIWTLVGIFIFSLVAGYLSIVTPTGLGIREGFIALGLSEFLPLSAAGFSAIFSRVIIVLSELIALVLSYAWYKARTRFLRQEKFITAHVHELILSLFVSIYAIYFTAISFLRYTQYYTGRFDLGNMAQTVWNTSQGRLFMITDPNGTAVVSRLAFHADFILILLAPFYWLWSDPRMLLFIQTVVVAGGAYFVYAIGNHMLKQKTVALVIAISFLINPSVQRANLYDFHAVVLATTFLLGSVYYLLKKQYILFIVFAVLAALTKEQLWFIIALFGPILFFGHKQRLLGTFLFIFFLGLFYYFLWVAIPNAAGQAHFALSYFKEGGESPSDVIKNILFSPLDSLQTALSGSRLEYYKKLLLPVGFLPLFYPFWLIMALPDLVLNIFSDRSQLQQIYYQYTATISAFLYVSMIYGVFMIRKYFPQIPQILIISFIVLSALLGAYLYGPLPGSREPNLAMITKPQPEREAIDRELARIPDDASVSASNNLASHLSERERIYVIPNGIGEADYVAIFKSFNNTNEKDTATLAEMRANTSYVQYFENSQIALFRKKTNNYNK